MSPEFLHLPDDERLAVLRVASEKLGRSQEVLEKDVWVCWALDALFSQPDHPKMAFKGGTSLSKAYNAIDRFSEDIDVTIDYKDLGGSVDPFEEAKKEGVSKKSIRRVGDDLVERVCDHVKKVVAPYLKQKMDDEFPGGGWEVEVSDDGESIHLRYPSVAEDRSAYLREEVRLEFGGRNMTDPSDTIQLTSYLAAEFPDVAFPTATVDVLAAERTFWEKVTLAHNECRRPVFKAGADRMSRHWYDLAELFEDSIGPQALRRLGLLDDVVKVKEVFFNASWSDYQLCRTGGAKLLPDEAGLTELEKDYTAMQAQGMLSDDAPPFAEVVTRVQALEDAVNAAVLAAKPTNG